MYKAIALDFDGVILESNQLKDRAFVEIFVRYPESTEDMIEYHRSHNAIPREQKFDHIIRNILKRNDKGLLKSWLKEYQENTRRELRTCDFVKGALEFLKSYQKKVHLFIITATPQEEIDWIIQQRDLGGYFKAVLGAPKKKVDHIKDLLASEGVSPQELLFIGDSVEDEASATLAGVPFIGRVGKDSFEKAKHPVVKDLLAFKEHLDGLH